MMLVLIVTEVLLINAINVVPYQQLLTIYHSILIHVLIHALMVNTKMDHKTNVSLVTPTAKHVILQPQIVLHAF